jgi:translation initiation factor eIF-2B subunit delta
LLRGYRSRTGGPRPGVVAARRGGADNAAMDGWEIVRRAAADRRSGAAEIAARAAEGLALLGAQRDVARASRHLVRAHPAMAPLWRLAAATLASKDHRAAAQRFGEQVAAESDGVARAAEWALPRRAVVITHSASSNVFAAITRHRGRIERVLCTASVPGGEGRSFARRLERAGIAAEVIPDAAVGRASEDASVAFVGADAVTENGAVNKVGTLLVALAAQQAGIGFYVLAGTSKLLPARAWRAEDAPLYEETPLALIDALITERGPMGTAAIRRAVRRIELPRALTARRGPR